MSEKLLKSEEYRGINIEFYKVQEGRKSMVQAAVIDRKNTIYEFPDLYLTKWKAYDDIRNQLDSPEFRKKLVDKINEKRKAKSDADSEYYRRYMKEKTVIINSASKSLGFEFKYDSYGETNLVMSYIPIYSDYGKFDDKPTLDIDLEKHTVGRIHYNLPKGFNYNGFGPESYKELNIKNIKNFSREYMRYLINGRKVAAKFKEAGTKRKLKVTRDKYYPKTRR